MDSPTELTPPAPVLAPTEASELDRYKEARKTGTPFAAESFASPSEPVSASGHATPEALADAADPPQPIADEPKHERWTDPDTGEQLDMRTRRAKRIKQLVDKAKDLETKLAEATTRQPPPATRETPRTPPVSRATSDDPEPTEAQFANEADPFTAYHRAVARWEGRQEARRIDADRQSVYQREQSREAFTRNVATYQDRLATARTRFPDFDAVVERASTPGTLSPVMQDAILSSEQGPDLTYWLATHQDDAKRLCAETLHCTRRDLPIVRRRLELELHAATPVATPKPPKAPPPAPVLGTGTVSPSGPAGPETTLSDWKKQRTWARGR